jgi:hypothetical protein
MNESDTKRYFPSMAAIRAYRAMLRREMEWWNWVAMFVIVVVAPPVLLIWIAASGNGPGFAIALIALIGAGCQALHNIQQRHEREARSADKAPEAENL